MTTTLLRALPLVEPADPIAVSITLIRKIDLATYAFEA